MFAAAPCTPLPFSTVTVTDDGGGAFCFSFVPSAAAFAAFGAVTSGLANWSTAVWMSLDEALQPRLHCTFSIFSWKRCPRGSDCAKSA